MPTRNVVLSQHLQDLIDTMVTSGRYQNASEVLRAGLRLLEQQEAEEAARLAALRTAADIGWADIADENYRDVADDELDSVIRQLGHHASRSTPNV